MDACDERSDWRVELGLVDREYRVVFLESGWGDRHVVSLWGLPDANRADGVEEPDGPLHGRPGGTCRVDEFGDRELGLVRVDEYPENRVCGVDAEDVRLPAGTDVDTDTRVFLCVGHCPKLRNEPYIPGAGFRIGQALSTGAPPASAILGAHARGSEWHVDRLDERGRPAGGRQPHPLVSGRTRTAETFGSRQTNERERRVRPSSWVGQPKQRSARTHPGPRGDWNSQAATTARLYSKPPPTESTGPAHSRLGRGGAPRRSKTTSSLPWTLGFGRAIGVRSSRPSASRPGAQFQRAAGAFRLSRPRLVALSSVGGGSRSSHTSLWTRPPGVPTRSTAETRPRSRSSSHSLAP